MSVHVPVPAPRLACVPLWQYEPRFTWRHTTKRERALLNAFREGLTQEDRDRMARPFREWKESQ